MNRLYSCVIALVLAFPAMGWDHGNFEELASFTHASVWRDLNRCGLLRLKAHDPRLPWPMVPADEAVVTRYGRLLAYTYRDFLSLGDRIEFKNPNGSFPHTIRLSKDFIFFVTPYSGIVARAERYSTATGPKLRLNCRNWEVPPEEFNRCIDREFVGLISDQLCRWSE